MRLGTELAEDIEQLEPALDMLDGLSERFCCLSEVYSGLSEVYSGLSEVYSGLSEVYCGLSEVFDSLSEVLGGLSEVYGGSDRVMLVKRSEDRTDQITLKRLLTKIHHYTKSFFLKHKHPLQYYFVRNSLTLAHNF